MSTTPVAAVPPVNLAGAAAALTERWSPRVVGNVNAIVVKVASIEGDFVWHNHPDTDEAFLCLSGELTIDLGPAPEVPDRSVHLRPGDLYVIPRAEFHCPHSATGATIALFEAAGTINTGAAGGALTAPVNQPLP